MKKSDKKLKEFNAFLSGVALDKYRHKYAKIKLVELGMPKNIQPIRHLYRLYWHDFNLLSYDNFYKLYSGELASELEAFRKQQMFSDETFYRGLPARIYRTWASLLTQIQGGYVAASLYPKVEMSTDLDYAGIDLRVYPGGQSGEYINIQIKKESVSREIRAPWIGLKKGQQITHLSYEVMPHPPLTKTGKESKPHKDWAARWDGKLKRLDNGFIIFRPGMFAPDEIMTP